MKSQILSLLITGLPFFMQAGVLTVSNHPNSPGQYTSISDAIAAASAGDTIYVHGSGVVYPAFTVNKQLTLIGPGHKPQKQVAAIVQIAPPNIIFASGSSGSVIMGFYFQSGLTIDPGVNNLRIQENYSTGTLSVEGTGHLIMKNILRSGIGLNNYGVQGNIMVRNNIIEQNLTGAIDATVEFSNNFIYSLNFCTNCAYTVFKNNIIWGTYPTSAINMTFLNNIAFLNINDTLPPPGSLGSGNIIGNPMFVSYPLAGTTFSYSHDYHLMSGSPAIGAGTDGTDIGIYGGVTPFDPYGEPPVPQVFEFNIHNPVIPSGGNLDIKITSKTKD